MKIFLFIYAIIMHFCIHSERLIRTDIILFSSFYVPSFRKFFCYYQTLISVISLEQYTYKD